MLSVRGGPSGYSNCPARAQEVQLLEVMNTRGAAHYGEAVTSIKERAHGYAGVVAKQSSLLTDPAVLSTPVEAVEKPVSKFQQPPLVDPASASVIAAAVEKGMSSVKTQFTFNIIECVSHMVVHVAS